MDVTTTLRTWRSAVLGVGLNIDGAYGNQCVDVDLSWGQTLFPGVHWSSVFPPVANAKQMFDTANETYWQKIRNDPSDANQLPQPGDVMVFDATPKAGYTNTYSNPSGHTGICNGANSGGYTLIQQDGSHPTNPAFESYTAWRYRPCIGWLRPKVNSAPTPPPAPAPAAHTLYLPASVDRWRVYARSGPFVPGREVGFVRPSLFSGNNPPGITYDIVGNRFANLYDIVTQTYGAVTIYAGADTDAVIR